MTFSTYNQIMINAREIIQEGEFSDAQDKIINMIKYLDPTIGVEALDILAISIRKTIVNNNYKFEEKFKTMCSNKGLKKYSNNLYNAFSKIKITNENKRTLFYSKFIEFCEEDGVLSSKLFLSNIGKPQTIKNIIHPKVKEIPGFGDFVYEVFLALGPVKSMMVGYGEYAMVVMFDKNSYKVKGSKGDVHVGSKNIEIKSGPANFTANKGITKGYDLFISMVTKAYKDKNISLPPEVNMSKQKFTPVRRAMRGAGLGYFVGVNRVFSVLGDKKQTKKIMNALMSEIVGGSYSLSADVFLSNGELNQEPLEAELLELTINNYKKEQGHDYMCLIDKPKMEFVMVGSFSDIKSLNWGPNKPNKMYAFMDFGAYGNGLKGDFVRLA